MWNTGIAYLTSSETTLICVFTLQIGSTSVCLSGVFEAPSFLCVSGAALACFCCCRHVWGSAYLSLLPLLHQPAWSDNFLFYAFALYNSHFGSRSLKCSFRRGSVLFGVQVVCGRSVPSSKDGNSKYTGPQRDQKTSVLRNATASCIVSWVMSRNTSN